MQLRSFCAAVFAFMGCTISGFAQIQLVGEHLTNPDAPELQAIGQQSVVYMPTSITSPVLYFTPFFAFTNTTDGKLKVDISAPEVTGAPWNVRLTLDVSPYQIRVAMAQQIRNWASNQG
jgi:hypothetical protein